MLLMHVCIRTRENKHLSLAERAQLSVQAWMEIEDIEQRLQRHTCELHSVFGFEAKEFLFAYVFHLEWLSLTVWWVLT